MDLPHRDITEFLKRRNIEVNPGLPSMYQSCGVAVVVPFFNEENYISRCLQSLVNQRLDSRELFHPTQFEIICVNNNSTDRSTSIVSEFIAGHPDHRIFQVDESRQGPAWARNKGVEIAIGRFVYSSRSLNESIIGWIDGDSEAGENWLVEIVKAFHNTEIMAAAGDKCYSTDIFELLCKTVPHAYLPGIVAQDMIREKIVTTLKPIRIPRLNGANSAIRASAYIDVGGLEQPYHDREKSELAPGEEFELAKKIVLKKYEIGLIPVINLTSGRRLVDSWIRSALSDGLINKTGEMIPTYTSIFTQSDDEFISKNMGVLRKVTKERWKELFTIHIDGCIKNLVTRDVMNATKRGRNIQSIVEEIYGGQWRLVTEKIRQGLDELPGENRGSLRFTNGFPYHSRTGAVNE